MPRYPTFRPTRTPGIYIRHALACPAAFADGPRCRCEPSYRGRRRHPLTRRPEWSPTSKDRAEVRTWVAAGANGADAMQEAEQAGSTFAELADEWWAGVESGAIGRRRGRAGTGYSDTTLQSYERTLRRVLIPEFGAHAAAALDERQWQRWIDGLARQGLSRSRIANLVAPASALYGWAAHPARRLVPRNPIRLVELPPNDEKPRLRVAPAEEAAVLIAALQPDDQVPYALAFYAGLRRAEIARLEWADVELDGYRLWVRKAKSEAGTDRRPPIAEPLRPILLGALIRQGRKASGRVSRTSVMSGKLGARADAAWSARALERITLHECRHTYASFLMAAGYTLKEIMEFMGHADLQMVQRYVKLLPQPEETNPADRLNAYLRRADGRSTR